MIAALFVASSVASPASAQTIFEDDFESVEPSCFESTAGDGERRCGAWSAYWRNDLRLAIERDGQRRSGRSALRLTFRANESEGGGRIGLDGESHVFTRYYERYSAEFDFGCGMKVHRLSSFDGSVNAFDIITFSRGVTSAAGDYCGVNDMASLNVQANGGRPVDWSLWNDLSMERERWYCVEHEILLNTPGRSDGAVRIWIDGALLGERVDQDIRAGLDAEINSVLFGGWYSNGCGGNPCADPESEAVRWIDDVAIARARIGCDAAPAEGDAGSLELDAGSIELDAGTLELDAGANEDAGAIDAGRAIDGSSRVDAATHAGSASHGCACGIAPARSSAPWYAAGVLLFVLRRRASSSA